jgi:hypothetical protein
MVMVLGITTKNICGFCGATMKDLEIIEVIDGFNDKKKIYAQFCVKDCGYLYTPKCPECSLMRRTGLKPKSCQICGLKG